MNRHALPSFAYRDDGADGWPFIVTADDQPAARVTDQDTAARTVQAAEQLTADGWPPAVAVVRALQDDQDDGAEGRSTAPGWLAWPDWIDRHQDAQGADQ